MAKIDTETLFLKLKAFTKANIGSVITAINAEKNDSTVLAVPNEKAYVDLSLDSIVINYDPFVYIYIDSIQSNANGSSISKEVRFEICIFKSKTGKDDEQILGLRYMRAMEDLAALAWDRVLRGFRYEVETLTPIDVKFDNSTKWHRVYGVALTVSLS